MRSQSNLCRNLQKVVGIRTCHICDAADLALSPEQAIVVELRNPIQVDSVDRHYAAFPKASQRRNHDVPVRGKGIALSNRVGGCSFSSPTQAAPIERAISLCDWPLVETNTLQPQEWSTEIAMWAEAPNPNRPKSRRLNAGHTETAKTNYTGTKQWRRLQITEPRGKREREIRSDQSILGISAIHVVSRENRRVTEIFHSPKAVRTTVIHAAHPRHTDAHSWPEAGRLTSHNLAYNLMSGDDDVPNARKFTCSDMQIRSNTPQARTRRSRWRLVTSGEGISPISRTALPRVRNAAFMK